MESIRQSRFGFAKKPKNMKSQDYKDFFRQD